MGVSSEVQRTLVKSPPELWAELSDPAALARHLGELGEIRIVRTQPETTVEWEASQATGRVQIKPSGWGTTVTLTATRELPQQEVHVARASRVGAEPASDSKSEAPAQVGFKATTDPESQAPAQVGFKATTDPESEGPAQVGFPATVDDESDGPVQVGSAPTGDAKSGVPAQVGFPTTVDEESDVPAQVGFKPPADDAHDAPLPHDALLQVGFKPTVDAGLESADSESELEPARIGIAEDPPEREPELEPRRGFFLRMFRRLRMTQPADPESPQAASSAAQAGEPSGTVPPPGSADSPLEIISGAAPAAEPAEAPAASAISGAAQAGEPSGTVPPAPADCPLEAISDAAPAGEPAAPPAAAAISDAAPAGEPPEATGVRADYGQGEAATYEPPPETQAEKTASLSAEPTAIEEVAAEQVTAVLISMLDRLGAAHHRPFSRA